MTKPSLSISLFILTLIFGGFSSVSVFAEDEMIHLNVQLVYAKKEMVKDSKNEKVDKKLAKTLRKIFDWKHYYTIFEEDVHIKGVGGMAKVVRCNKHCRIEVKMTSKTKFEVKFYGKKKLLLKQITQIMPGSQLALAGPSGDDSAWFIVLTRPIDKKKD